jgi:hypothetical protein
VRTKDKESKHDALALTGQRLTDPFARSRMACTLHRKNICMLGEGHGGRDSQGGDER